MKASIYLSICRCAVCEWLLIFSALLFLSSCQRTLVDEVSVDSETAALEGIMVRSSRLPFFADIEEYNLNPATKGSGYAENDILLTLESLLDRNRAETITVNQYTITSIPFFSEYCQESVSLSEDRNLNSYEETSSAVKIYLIKTVDTSVDTVDYMVVTMVPDRMPEGSVSPSDFTYAHRERFQGICIYSTLEGEYIQMLRFSSNPIRWSGFITPGEDTVGRNVMYLCAGESECQTKMRLRDAVTCYYNKIFMVDGGGSNVEDEENPEIEELEEAYCYADRKKKKEEKEKKEEKKEEKKDVTDDETGRKKGGGGATKPGSTGQGSNKNTQANQKQMDRGVYTVKLTATEGGHTVGSGSYVPNQKILIGAAAEGGWRFEHWVGTYSSSSITAFVTVEEDITSTAIFHRNIEPYPCKDLNKGYNPLSYMYLAPTQSGSIVGATYGNTRYGGTKSHNGIDFAAEVGTPVYAMYGGIIGKVVSGQPDRHKEGEDWVYPDSYKGDTNNAGNRIYVTSRIGGHQVSLGYWHLRAGNAIATNPRTGKPFKSGDAVYAGELIGYTGQTGNGIEAKTLHLHLNASVDGKKANPAPYVNGTVSKDKTAITDIECDDYKYGF